MSAKQTPALGTPHEGELDWIVRAAPQNPHLSPQPAGSETRVIVIRHYPWLSELAQTHENLPRL